MILSPVFVDYYTPVFKAIAAKATQDQSLREDLVQTVFLELLSVDEEKIHTNKDAFVRMVARNTMWNELKTHGRGNWYTGRTVDGKPQKSRYVAIEELLQHERMQISEDGQVLPGPGKKWMWV